MLCNGGVQVRGVPRDEHDALPAADAERGRADNRVHHVQGLREKVEGGGTHEGRYDEQYEQYEQWEPPPPAGGRGRSRRRGRDLVVEEGGIIVGVDTRDTQGTHTGLCGLSMWLVCGLCVCDLSIRRVHPLPIFPTTVVVAYGLV